MTDFDYEVSNRIQLQAQDKTLVEAANAFMEASLLPKYSYNFSWLGRPIIQYPQDIVAMQELIWNVKPDLIIETGIAHGGSLIFSASMLALLDVVDVIEGRTSPDSLIGQNRKVIGIDIDIREHNRKAIQEHPMSSRIQLIEGSSIDENVVNQVAGISDKFKKVLVCLDSNHTHDHVFAELECYSPFVSIDSYCVVFDTIVEDIPAEFSVDRPWGPGNNPKTAVWKFLEKNKDFVIDNAIQDKLLVTVAKDGYLKRI